MSWNIRLITYWTHQAFSEAKQFGDILIVSVTADDYVQKGPNRPVFNLSYRMEAKCIRRIDYVAF